ncbi:MAG: hypothetical protein U1E76_12725 [Planctomycetota bacterium]
MAVLRGFLEPVQHACLDAGGRLLRQAELAGDAIGDGEANAGDVAAQAERVRGPRRAGAVAVCLQDLLAQRRPGPEAAQEDLQVALRTTLLPGLEQRGAALLAEHPQDLVRLIVEHLHRTITERRHELLRGPLPMPLTPPRSR